MPDLERHMTLTLSAKYLDKGEYFIRRLGRFQCGHDAYGIESLDGQPVARLNVSPESFAMESMPRHNLIVKDYSESEGLALALVASGAFELTGQSMQGNFDSHFYILAMSPETQERLL